ncbi:hypothetical protein DAEQUDRAFT_767812 [Daedalea quercina L-15889]|uniref:Uncharacterized protein n=1 Tax=Daedalea quercina L-15889 TaxID=1314783 RepID=A0A165NAB7_9APHY|nr:hypothetical protein DAEQUDRAFT_767812 [Daedalea quercina L-15889]
MSATTSDADSPLQTDASPSLSYPTAITTLVYTTVSNSVVGVITTTSYSGAPIATTSTSRAKTSIPVAPIAGGAAGGVFLAVAVVVAWVWWGKCIKRKTLKERRETLARLQVRENTRRNASSGSFTSLPQSHRTSRREKKVSFASTPSSTASTLRGTDDKEDVRSEKTSATLVTHFDPSAPASKDLINAHKPVRPSPLGRANSRNEGSPLLPTSRMPSSRPTTPPQSPFKDTPAPPPPRRQSQDSAPVFPRRQSQDTALPRRLSKQSAPASTRRPSQDSAPTSTRRRPSQDSATPFPTLSTSPIQPSTPTRPSPTQSPSPTSPVQPFLKRPLAKQVTHKASAASSMSAYSTESGEERQKRVSTSLVMAALGHLDPRRSWLGNYLPLSRRSRVMDDVEQSRLSTMSAASAYSQTSTDEHVGYAYGGEESTEGPKQTLA